MRFHQSDQYTMEQWGLLSRAADTSDNIEKVAGRHVRCNRLPRSGLDVRPRNR